MSAKSKTDQKVILYGFLYCNVSFLWKKETQKLFKIDNPEYLVSQCCGKCASKCVNSLPFKYTELAKNTSQAVCF